jgi:putative ABC transport system substrate-binding protein
VAGREAARLHHAAWRRAVAWPLAASAQQTAMSVIGFLHFGSPDLFTFQAKSFAQGLKETGYVEGQNVAIEYRWAEGRYDRLPSLATDLVSHKVKLIAAFGPPCAKAAKNATSTIPIVFTIGSDPVHDGLHHAARRRGG